MQNALSDILVELQGYGALQSQLVNVANDNEPRVLNYTDLRAPSTGWRRPIVVESAGRPCVHVFDGRDGAQKDQIAHWCWRVALRGDGAWVGVLEPGRLRIYSVDIVDNEVKPGDVITAVPGDWALPKLLHGMQSGQDDLPRRRYLLQLLERSAHAAVRGGLCQTDALSFVGRGLFWRFLLDRGLLKGLDPGDICDTATTWESCLDTKARALKTFRWLDETFNGGLLPFEVNPKEFDSILYSGVLGNIAHGATETGQLRLPTDWDEVNFSYVPVGLLSEVYEAFAHNLNAKEAAERSVHYTPAHLVDFLVTQSLDQLPGGSRPRILDPAVGAGVFLVTAFRRLVERDWREKGERPKRKRIREILNRQLVGFDIDTRALRLTELALYLTALELDPKPKPLNELKFETLRGKVLFDLSSRKHGSLGPVEDHFRGQFDLVIGNPPWTAKSKALKEKKAWVAHSMNIAKKRLGDEAACTFDFPDTNIDLPFFWRAMEWAKTGGSIAFITHSRWLFGISNRSAQARNYLMQAIRVTGILNGSALRLSNVWPKVAAPWCMVFATNEIPTPFDRSAFQFISPSLDAEVDSKQARMRIDWLDAQVVLATEVVEYPWMLKARFRGNRVAIRAFESMRKGGEELGRYLGRLGVDFKNGYQVGGKAGKQKDASPMFGMPDTKDTDSLGFVVDADALPRFKRKTLLFPRNISIYKKPLLLVKKCIPSNPLTPRASRADVDLAFHESYHGISFAGLREPAFLARYLQLWFQSSAMVFVELLTDGLYGVERDSIYQESLYRIPVVPVESLSLDQCKRAMVLSEQLGDGLTEDLAIEIDNFIFDTFYLSDLEKRAIWDTLDTAQPSSSSKKRAVTPPDVGERERFIDALKESLNSVLSASEKIAVVKEREDLHRDPWRFLEVQISHDGSFSTVDLPVLTFLEEANENGASLVMVHVSKTVCFVGLIDRYLLWTQTRARILATDILSERASR